MATPDLALYQPTLPNMGCRANCNFQGGQGRSMIMWLSAAIFHCLIVFDVAEASSQGGPSSGSSVGSAREIEEVC